MDTKLLNSTEVELVADLLKNNEVVGFPTETVYGLGVLFDSEEAFKKMMEAKNRPPHKAQSCFTGMVTYRRRLNLL